MSAEKRALELIHRYDDLRVGVPSPKWTALSNELGSIIREGDDSLLDAISQKLEERDHKQFWVARQHAFRGLGLIRKPESVKRFLEGAKNPPRCEEIQRASDVAEAKARKARAFGALLGYAQNETMLERAIGWFGEDLDLMDVLATWTMDLALRGAALEQRPAIVAYWRLLGELGHALAVLPLSLLELERGLVRAPVHEYDYLGNWMWFTDSIYPTNAERPGAKGSIPFSAFKEQTLSDAKRHAMSNGLDDPWLFPNATAETRVLELEAPLSAPLLQYDLRSLPLECLDDESRPDVRLFPRTAKQIYALLLSIASAGGAYAEGRCMAYGRLHAWQALAAMTDASPDAAKKALALDETQARANAMQWAYFETQSKWFHQVCIDVGLVGYDAASPRLVVLAGTDSD